MQKVIANENLLENCQKRGNLLGNIAELSGNITTSDMNSEKLLREKLESPNAIAHPFVFDIRGGGLFWGVEFDFETEKAKATSVDLKGEAFAMLVQAKALENGLVIIGMAGGSNLAGTKGSHILLAPAYNTTEKEIETIVETLATTIEQVLRQYGV